MNFEGKIILMKANEQSVAYYDLLNIAACLAVVALHHNSSVHKYNATSAWVQALIVEVLFYWAVPCFFMMSGAKLLTYRDRYDTRTFLKKRIRKILLPFVFWSTLIIFSREIIGTPVLQTHSMSTFLDLLINYKAAPTYYFFPAIIAMYLIIPILSLLVKNRKILWYIVAVMFTMQSCVPFLLGMFGITIASEWGTGFTSYVIYIILGYLLSTENILGKTQLVLLGGGIFGAVFRYVYIFYVSTSEGTLDKLFFNYVAFPAVFLSVAVFVFFKNYFNHINDTKILNIIKEISKCTFGIYMVHNTFVMPVERVVLGLNNESLLWRTGMILVTWFVSLVIVWIMKHIPIIKYVVP